MRARIAMKFGCHNPRRGTQPPFAIALMSLALLTATPAWAGGAHSLFIMDANTGATLTDIEGNDPRYPASLTKMMTLYLAFEAIENGRATMKTPIKISLAATHAAPSKLDLAVGDDLSLEDAVMALITKSANDVAIAVAEHLGGSEANFAKLMTAKARELGMKSTTFKNASGLPNSEQTTTARDMTTLGVRLYDDFPRYFPLFSTRSHNYNGSTFRNHNTLMLQMPGINGIKTGYTHASGFNLVSSLQHDGRHLIGAIFGGQTAGSRNAQMRVALNRALAKAATAKTRKPVLMAKAEAKAAADAAKKTKTVVAAAKSAQVPAPVQVASTAAVPSAPALKIDLAKVRPTSVATAPPQAPAFAQASTTPRIADIVRNRLAKTPAATVETPDAVAMPVNEPALRQPSSFETQMAGLARNIQPPAVSNLSPAVVAAPPAPVASVRPPSSLGAQLAELTAPPSKMATPSYRLQGPDAATPPAPAAPLGFVIQIGAFASPAEADKKLASVANQVPNLAGHKPMRQTVTAGDKTLYRARFTGFDQQSAQAACAELNRIAINCLALKAE
jgi:D-alanyl-D-alanine carboxypeptidase